MFQNEEIVIIAKDLKTQFKIWPTDEFPPTLTRQLKNPNAVICYDILSQLLKASLNIELKERTFKIQ